MAAGDINLLVFGAAMAVMLWASLVFLILASKARNHWLKRLGMMVICTNGALLWSTSTLMRMTDHMDAALINNWSRVFYAMFAFYTLGFAVLNWWVPRKATGAHE